MSLENNGLPTPEERAELRKMADVLNEECAIDGTLGIRLDVTKPDQKRLACIIINAFRLVGGKDDNSLRDLATLIEGLAQGHLAFGQAHKVVSVCVDHLNAMAYIHERHVQDNAMEKDNG